MNVLAIGNSFSQDATRYLHGIARADGVPLHVVNLYIGGCSLERHYRNMLSGERAYILQCDGVSTGFNVSLVEALTNRQWDVITLQQVSTLSFDRESYLPYITVLADFVRKYAPRAKVFLHQTWAYADGSDRLAALGLFPTAADMLKEIVAANKEIAAAIAADGIIPSGELMQGLLSAGVPSVHRDTTHASLGLGRYALALLWYRVLVGTAVSGNTFSDFDEEIGESDRLLAKSLVDGVKIK